MKARNFTVMARNVCEGKEFHCDGEGIDCAANLIIVSGCRTTLQYYVEVYVYNLKDPSPCGLYYNHFRVCRCVQDHPQPSQDVRIQVRSVGANCKPQSEQERVPPVYADVSASRGCVVGPHPQGGAVDDRHG